MVPKGQKPPPLDDRNFRLRLVCARDEAPAFSAPAW